MRQVEQSGPGPDRPMLFEDARVLEWHQPAGELDHPCPESRVPLGKRGRQGRDVRLSHRGVDLQSLPLRRPAVEREVGGSSDQTPVSESRVAARPTSERSVSNDRRPAASSNEIQRTSSNSWSWRSKPPPVGSIMK